MLLLLKMWLYSFFQSYLFKNFKGYVGTLILIYLDMYPYVVYDDCKLFDIEKYPNDYVRTQ